VIISHRHRFAFIHNPKAGGTSIELALATYAPFHTRIQFVRRIIHRYARDAPAWSVYRLHMPAWDFRARVEKRREKDYFVFGSARHPFTRVESLFRYVLSHPEHEFHQRARSCGHVDDFAEWYGTRGDGSQFQSYYLANRQMDGLAVDAICKQETLQEDFDGVLRHLGLSRIELPNLNRSRHVDGGRLSDHGRRIVAELFAVDFQLLGYVTEDELPPMREDR